MKDATRATLYLGLSCIPVVVGSALALLFQSSQMLLFTVGAVTSLLLVRLTPRAWHYVTNYERATFQYSREFNKNYRYEKEGPKT